ncbi:MAG: TMEM165/GDT1 family protein [Rhodocyclaceae bacterium]|jgi:putative Ca2+/H+ antiporter (TMEM165/GDT1 family)|nr:TMEM165/GDT1 family protein [Rhodocyclaceae bacterium]MBK6909048.1 TMEM165/GDT1 family protein [Rhodocyclaceae bacterium]
MEAFLLSSALVALAEVGDKTQLLALVLATRFKKPLPIIAGIFVATVLNHALAGTLGSWITTTLEPDTLRWIVGLSFLAMAAWTLIPDQLDDDDTQAKAALGAFTATLIAFFLAEMGDKTQVATVALAARFNDLIPVVMGTTIGMLLANVPVVLFGEAITRKLPVAVVHKVTAVIFAVLGVLTLLVH